MTLVFSEFEPALAGASNMLQTSCHLWSIQICHQTGLLEAINPVN
jgi:hypothetical protein